MRHLNIISILALFMVLNTVSAQHNAIFNGGTNEGYSKASQSSQDNNAIFGGGENDGYYSEKSSTTTGNGIFSGGVNDGYGITRTVSQSNNSIFSGGVNDGYHKLGVPIATNNDLFTGGINDGYSRMKVASEQNNGIYSGGINDGYAVRRSSEIVDDPNLPIELLYFDAIADGEEVITMWETVSEFNNDYFTVEKMKTVSHIVEVGSLPSQGNGQENRFYELLDVSPFPGTSYYRLRQTDLDGTVTWSDWVAVHFDEENTNQIDFSVLPNPVYGDEFDIIISGLTQNEDMIVRIFDMRGVLIHKDYLETLNNSRIRKTIQPASELAGGMYIIEVSGQDYRSSRKLVVVR